MKSVLLHLTRLWLGGLRLVVLLACLGALSWIYAARFAQALPSPAELQTPHPLETSHLEMAAATRGDLTLDFSRGVSEPLNNWLPHRTDGLVRPLWPWMAAWLMTDREQQAASGPAPQLPHALAQRVHLTQAALTTVVLIMLGLALARAFSVPAVLLMVFLIGFGVFLPAARYFLPGLFFSLLFLLTWIACIAALKRNSLWLYGAIGFLAALANLTAPTTTTLVLVFVMVSTLRWMWGWLMEHLPREGGTSLWVRRNHWLGLILLAVTYLFTVGPMISFAHQSLGDATPFHWRWFDSAAELRAWTETHHSRETLARVPEDKRPSFENYRTTHTEAELHLRLKSGLDALRAEVLPHAWSPTVPRGLFAAALGGALLLMLMMVWFVAPRAHHAGQALHPETAPIVLFTLLALGVCSIDFAWDMQVLDYGQRSLALYPPLVLSLVWAGEAVMQRLRRRQMRVPVLFFYEALLWLLCAAGVWWMIAFLQPGSITA